MTNPSGRGVAPRRVHARPLSNDPAHRSPRHRPSRHRFLQQSLGILSWTLAWLAGAAISSAQSGFPADANAIVRAAYETMQRSSTLPLETFNVATHGFENILRRNLDGMPLGEIVGLPETGVVSGDLAVVAGQMLYTPEWSAFAEPIHGQSTLAAQSIGSIIALEAGSDPAWQTVLGATRFTVDLTMGKQRRTYRAAVFWLPSPDGEGHRARFVDAFLADLTTLITNDPQATGSGGIKTPVGANVSPGEICVPGTVDSERFDWLEVDGPVGSDHYGLGLHMLAASATTTCACDAQCDQTCELEWTQFRCRDTMPLAVPGAPLFGHLIYPWHETVGARGQESENGYLSGASCTLDAKCAVRGCTTPLCAFDVTVGLPVPGGFVFELSPNQNIVWQSPSPNGNTHNCEPCTRLLDIAGGAQGDFPPDGEVELIWASDTVNQQVTVADDGGFRFPERVPEGESYSIRKGAESCVSCALGGPLAGILQDHIDGLSLSCQPVGCVPLGFDLTFETASGDSASGGFVQVLLATDSGSQDVSVNVAGHHEFPGLLNEGDVWALTAVPSFPVESCTIAEDSGTVEGSGPINTQITCVVTDSATPRTVSFQSSILNEIGEPHTGAGSSFSATIHLEGRSGGGATVDEDITIGASSGTFTFTQTLSDGWTYEVYPSATNDGDCFVVNGIGEVAGGDVDDIEVECTAWTDWNSPENCEIYPEICYVPDLDCRLGVVLVDVTVVTVTPSNPDDPSTTTVTNYWQVVYTCPPQAAVAGGAPATQRTDGPIVHLRTRTDLPWSETVTVAGVARDDVSGAATVRVLIDGQAYHPADLQTDLFDPWTCQEIGAAGCDEQSRFRFTLDTRNLENGDHSMVVFATAGGDRAITSYQEIDFTVDNGGTGGPDTTGPTVWIESPPPGADLEAGTVTITARATDDSGVAHVTFLVDGTTRFLDAEAPYAWDWPADVGRHVIRAVAVDSLGNDGSSMFHIVDVHAPTDTVPPTVSLTTPSDGAELAPGSVVLTATAGDASGIDLVEFLVDGSVRGSDPSPPFAWTWQATLGTHDLMARAHDNNGNRTDSAIHRVTVAEPADTTPPTVSLTHPLPGSTHPHGAISLTATAADGAEAVAFVEFYAGTTRIAVDAFAPFQRTWVAAPGVHGIRARAEDAAGNSAWSAEHTITVTGPCTGDTSGPTVTIDSPASGLLDFGNGSVPIVVTAIDPSGISDVDFLVDDASIGTVTSPTAGDRFERTWTIPAPATTYRLRATARDACGNERTSDPVDVTVRILIDP